MQFALFVIAQMNVQISPYSIGSLLMMNVIIKLRYKEALCMKKLLSVAVLSSALLLGACGSSDGEYELVKDTVVRGMQQYTVETKMDKKEDIEKLVDELEEKAMKANTRPDSMWINVQTKHGKVVAKIKEAYTLTGMNQTGLKEKNKPEINMQ